MGRAALLALLLLASSPVAADAGSPRFAVRAVKVVGSLDEPETQEHVRWARSRGFDALFLYAGQAGRWWDDRRRSPRLSRAFRRLAGEARKAGTRLLVSANPPADSHHRFVFDDAHGLERLVRFAQLLHEVGVSDFVLSFDDQPRTLRNLRDVMRYGEGAAPAHLDLTMRLAARLPAGMRLWLCASAYADVHLGDGTGPYSRAFLAGLPALPPAVGIVWTGPDVVSPTITREDLHRTRARLGGRPLLLYDNFPENESRWRDGLAVVLGPLRGRGPDLAAEAEIYLACPMVELGASRLALTTTADWLRDPDAYVPEASWAAAIDTLAGPHPGAREALRAQAAEWGTAPGEPGYPVGAAVAPEGAAHGFHDPAVRARWQRVVDTYPARIDALASAADGEFSWDLRDVLRRTLTVARAWLAVDDGDGAALEALWRESRGTARRALLGFRREAGIP
ncbi:MAG TPA: beta-N-acetylglucosaminidase domain-containing protein [Candidatus Polarisedimenticolaceae bacterium]|nr:beta-N-acetylglucosaminidase domain-containing protein [Candidatus Polarisedimenticolaceae bacterium]